MFYSKQTNGFYVHEIHGDNIPADAVAITYEYHTALLQGQSRGKCITADENGHPVLQDPPAPTAAQIEMQKITLVQAHMDAQARAIRYADIATACSYAEESAVPKFQAEGQAFRIWRSLVWADCYSIMNEVIAGDRAIPTDEELIAALPTLKLPV